MRLPSCTWAEQAAGAAACRPTVAVACFKIRALAHPARGECAGRERHPNDVSRRIAWRARVLGTRGRASRRPCVLVYVLSPSAALAVAALQCTAVEDTRGLRRIGCQHARYRICRLDLHH